MSIGLAMMRITIGLLLIGHGCQKLFGWFGGGGLEGTGPMFDKIGLRPGRFTGALAGSLETTGGSLLVVGALTPFAAAAIATVMAGAFITVHRRNGLWNTNGGFEYPLVVAMVVLAMAFTGPGRFSIDHALQLPLRGLVWGSLAIGLAALGACSIIV